jgi:hypothetical protein
MDSEPRERSRSRSRSRERHDGRRGTDDFPAMDRDRARDDRGRGYNSRDAAGDYDRGRPHPTHPDGRGYADSRRYSGARDFADSRDYPDRGGHPSGNYPGRNDFGGGGGGGGDRVWERDANRGGPAEREAWRDSIVGPAPPQAGGLRSLLFGGGGGGGGPKRPAPPIGGGGGGSGGGDMRGAPRPRTEAFQPDPYASYVEPVTGPLPPAFAGGYGAYVDFWGACPSRLAIPSALLQSIAQV